MLQKPSCYDRQCKHFEGVRRLGKEESTEVCVCAAFPNGIPDEISYGDNLHDKPLKDQKNSIVYEKE